MTEHVHPDIIQNLLQKVETIITDMAEIRQTLQSYLGLETMEIPPEWFRRRLTVWAAVHERGDVIQYEEFKRITREVGYDPRGIGGFFTGDNSSMKWVGETKVGIDPWVLDYIEQYEEWLDTVDIP